MKTTYIALYLLFCTCFTIFGQAKSVPNIKTQPFVLGEKISFASQILKEERVLNIYLPYNYHPDSLQKYPVIYLLDGSADEDFIHIAGLVQFCSFSWINIIPESIVVGIANVNRMRDFTFPTNNKQDKLDFPTSGGSEKFIHFLKEEVQILIHSQYKVTDEKTIIGQSLGGLLTTEIMLKQPDLFDNYIIVSPSLWWDDMSLLNENTSKITPPKKIYVAVGKEGPTMEGTAMRLISDLQKLRKRELEKIFIVDYDILNNLDHSNILHEAVFRAFQKINRKDEANTKH